MACPGAVSFIRLLCGALFPVLGACLWQSGRREEGRPLPVAGHERLRQARGEALATQRARRRLAVTQGQQPATAAHSSGDH